MSQHNKSILLSRQKEKTFSFNFNLKMNPNPSCHKCGVVFLMSSPPRRDGTQTPSEMSQAWMASASHCILSEIRTVRELTPLRKGWRAPGLAFVSQPMSGNTYLLQKQLLSQAQRLSPWAWDTSSPESGPYIPSFPCLPHWVTGLQSLLSFLWSP